VIRIRIVKEDIAKLDVDAVVNAANDHLWMGAGVAGALKTAGGGEIEREAMAKGPIAVGEAVVTGGGRLKARHVIHAAVMTQFVPRTSADAIARATAASLARAEEIGAKTVGFPAFGTGVAGFPLAECARVMVAAVKAHNGSVEEVVFALRGDDAVRAFEAAL
jgi:O-acetyl-ADP-ribose deacetylase (regulator of RNase III)